MSADDRQITQLLKRWSDGDEAAFAALAPLVYDELRKLAGNAFRQERGGHTLQATAVVHEAYLQLVNASVDWDSRAHFYALAARMMRRILLNHANAKAAEKRGGDAVRVTFDEATVRDREKAEDVIDLDRALCELAREDKRMADIVELHYFGGLTYKEAGRVLEISEATAKRALRFGKAWIAAYLERNVGPPP
ncbi:sigma-70 family RNA polymerase sigma factor [Wenzhouxiangella sp. XN24]|uniref:sigma-70 family RNA polymerase sigma factor n=1 Tax=Wenzhouxiangella sp. XN24 TaxID=2713569 RepID=UPI0013ECCB10|nr:sigma-70 family RNA polymerase sigma factor [Wenzhouxiangella sp. XN24]NGX16289.1 sigma-70 family RNA polymerase sigma factor [Wenzhouxiangella sp. XN24]